MAILESEKRANVNLNIDPKFKPRVDEKERSVGRGNEKNVC